MNLKENFEKLECAKLQAQKEKLFEQLNSLKKLNISNLLNEEMGGAHAGSVGHGQSTQQQPQYQQPRKMPSKKGRQMMPGMGQEQQLPPGTDPRTGFSIQAQFGIPDPNLRTMKKDGVAALQKAQQPQTSLSNEYPLSMPLQGFALTPEWAQTQQHYVQNWYDVKEIPGRQVAEKPTWQNLQIALSNYFGSQVNELMRKQRMLG